MNLEKFNKHLNARFPMRRLLAQDVMEWRIFMEFIEAYFKNRAIAHPVIVEIGLMHNAQKAFYEELLGAEHIGIDINPNCNPDILGDSHKPQTMQELYRLLYGRPIDLLFIDANHSYKNVKEDYELFAPITRYIIALHDVFATVNSEVSKYWAEISKTNEHVAMTFINHNSKVSAKDNKFVNMGIGLILKEKN